MIGHRTLTPDTKDVWFRLRPTPAFLLTGRHRLSQVPGISTHPSAPHSDAGRATLHLVKSARRNTAPPGSSRKAPTMKFRHSTTQLREPLRLPLPQATRVMVSPVLLTQPDLRAATAERLSQIQMLFFRCALSPITPSSSICACVYFFHTDSRLRHIRKVSRWKLRVTRPKQVHLIRAHIFVVHGVPSRVAPGRNPAPQCFACFVTSARQSATN